VLLLKAGVANSQVRQQAAAWSLDISQHSSSGAVNEARRPGWELLGVVPPERGADWKTPSWRSEGRALRLRRTLAIMVVETQILDQPQTSGHEHVHDHVNVHIDVHVSVDVVVIGLAKLASPPPGLYGRGYPLSALRACGSLLPHPTNTVTYSRWLFECTTRHRTRRSKLRQTKAVASYRTPKRPGENNLTAWIRRCERIGLQEILR
jgi:hypothetical protein